MGSLAVGEVVVAHGSHHLPVCVDEPVILGKGIENVLRGDSASHVLVHQVVVHEVGADGEDAACVPAVAVNASDSVLHVAVVAHVQTVDFVVVRLVVLVEGV